MNEFWKSKALNELSNSEWESLCDGCGRCCLQKLQCADTDEVFYTELACEYLDLETCRCTDYGNRTGNVESCVDLKTLKKEEWGFMPTTCAYRLLIEGKDLFDWHPLKSGSHEAMHEAGISVMGKVFPDKAVREEDYEEHIVTWVHC